MAQTRARPKRLGNRTGRNEVPNREVRGRIQDKQETARFAREARKNPRVCAEKGARKNKELYEGREGGLREGCQRIGKGGSEGHWQRSALLRSAATPYLTFFQSHCLRESVSLTQSSTPTMIYNRAFGRKQSETSRRPILGNAHRKSHIMSCQRLMSHQI